MTVLHRISFSSLLILLVVSCSSSSTQPETSVGGATAIGGNTSAGNPSIGGTVASGGETQTSSTSAALFGFPDGMIVTSGTATLVASGLPSALGKSWGVTSIGAAGTIEITASVTGGATVSSQFVVEAGAQYVLTVCVPVNTSSGGPLIKVSFPGSNATLPSGNAASDKFVFNAPATGAPMIGLTQDSKATVDLVSGKFTCP